jgi:hypothetical protein
MGPASRTDVAKVVGEAAATRRVDLWLANESVRRPGSLFQSVSVLDLFSRTRRGQPVGMAQLHLPELPSR